MSNLVASSALNALAYGLMARKATTRKAIPTTSDNTCAWLNTRVACAWSRRPVACATSVVVPTPSICVAARTMKVRLPLMPTAATAAVPRRPTQYRSTRT